MNFNETINAEKGKNHLFDGYESVLDELDMADESKKNEIKDKWALAHQKIDSAWNVSDLYVAVQEIVSLPNEEDEPAMRRNLVLFCNAKIPEGDSEAINLAHHFVNYSLLPRLSTILNQNH